MLSRLARRCAAAHLAEDGLADFEAQPGGLSQLLHPTITSNCVTQHIHSVTLYSFVTTSYLSLI